MGKDKGKDRKDKKDRLIAEAKDLCNNEKMKCPLCLSDNTQYFSYQFSKLYLMYVSVVCALSVALLVSYFAQVY